MSVGGGVTLGHVVPTRNSSTSKTPGTCVLPWRKRKLLADDKSELGGNSGAVSVTWLSSTGASGTASISGAAPNHVDNVTGYVCGPSCGGSITVVGSGTQWLTGTPTQKLGVGDQIWVEWDADGAGSKTGRWLDQVGSVVDNTHFTINGAGGYWQIPVSLSGSMTIQRIGSDLGGYTLAAQPAASWNYYEALLGGIRLAAATNLDLYNNQSQAFCNLWWQYGLDHGYRGTIPRNSGYHSMIACAVKYGFNDSTI